jgi:hypothetical protein
MQHRARRPRKVVPEADAIDASLAGPIYASTSALENQRNRLREIIKGGPSGQRGPDAGLGEHLPNAHTKHVHLSTKACRGCQSEAPATGGHTGASGSVWGEPVMGDPITCDGEGTPSLELF